MTSNEDYLDSLLANLNNQTSEQNDAFFDEIKEKEDENLLDILNEDINEEAEESVAEEAVFDSVEDLIPSEEEFTEPTIGENVEEALIESEYEEPASENAYEEPASESEYEEPTAEEIPENFAEEETENIEFTEEETENEVSEEAVSEEAVIEEEEAEIPEIGEENEEIPTEEFIDMDDIDALLSDVSDIHPERSKSSEELEQQIARYEENPEAAEEALLNDDSEENAETEESVPDENADDFLSNLEDVDALLADVENKAKEEEDKLASERSERTDGDLDEINDILSKSDNNEAVNDDLLSMIEGLDNENDEGEEGLFENETDDVKEDKKEKKEKKKEKKKKKADDKADKKEKGGEEKEKKSGLFSKLLGFMFEEDEEEAEENKEENKEESKGKKDKKGKKKKDKGGAKADDNAAIEAELDEEDAKSKKGKKEKKEKKPKKEKAPKKEKKAKPEETEEKQKSSIKKKGIILTAAFCATLLAVILFATIMGPKVLARNEARTAYYNRDYETACIKLSGMKLGESDRLIYEKASILYRLELFLDKVEAYETLGDKTKKLDALLQTWEECENLSVEARLLSITEEVEELQTKTEEMIAEEYHLTTEDIIAITEMKPVYYTIAVNKTAAGENYKEMPEETVLENTNEEESKAELEDVLPEELELIGNPETEE